MMWQLVFILTLSVLQVPASENLHASSHERSSVEIARKANPGQFPHQAQLRMVSIMGVIDNCGGSIIHKEWVVSAAHCTVGRTQITVMAGVTYLSAPEVSMNTWEYYLYPTFDVSTPKMVQRNDISLVKLPRPLQYSPNIHSIRIQPPSDAFKDYRNELIYASGFGLTMTDGLRPEVLQWVHLQGISQLDCSRVYGPTLINANTVCGQFYNLTSHSTCQGESGGPLVHEYADGGRFLIGITSFLPDLPHGCHPGMPGAFTRPAPFYDWFEEITGIDFRNLDESVEWTIQEPPSTPGPITVSPPTNIPEPEEEEKEEKKEEDDQGFLALLKKLEINIKIQIKFSKSGHLTINSEI